MNNFVNWRRKRVFPSISLLCLPLLKRLRLFLQLNI